MRLYTYYRSTSSYRVRIALALKNVTYEPVPVHLARNGGEQNSDAFRLRNPQGRVPVLVLNDEAVLLQSPAIIEYLDEVYPAPPLLPEGAAERAKIRAAAAIISCDIHPLNNVSPLNYLRSVLGQSEDAVSAWIAHWIRAGFDAVERLIGEEGYCFGGEPSLADVYLIPQVYSARRFGVALDSYPRIVRVDALASNHPAFLAAHPSRQIDGEYLEQTVAARG